MAIEEISADPAPVHRRWISDHRLYRTGSMCGMVGAIVAFPFVVTHPHLPPGDVEGVLKTVEDFGPWLFLHMGLMYVLVVIIFGLAAISRSLDDDRSREFGTAAFIVAIIATTLGILGQGIDGLGFNIATAVYRAAPADNKAAALQIAGGIGGVATGVFILVELFYFGLTSLFYAWAFATSKKQYPWWITLMALAGGVLGTLAGCFTYYDEFTDPVYYGLFIPSAVLFLLWVFAASAHLWWRQRLVDGRARHVYS